MSADPTNSEAKGGLEAGLRAAYTSALERIAALR